LVYSFLSDLGLQQHRLDGDDYLAVIDEFMEAVFTRWPNVIVQVLKVMFKIKIVACICVLFTRSICFYYTTINNLVLSQFEDFQSKWAFKLLQRYRTTYRMFNDDVQVKFLLYNIVS
jgi:malate dehydrogenase (decarboxylating)